MRWSDVDPEACSVSRTLEVLGDRWTVLVIREVFNGVRRFAEMREHLGISGSVLSQRLSGLVEQGVLERRAYRDPGDRERHEYRLTPLGKDLRPVLIAMMDFSDKHRPALGGPAVELTHRKCGARVHARLVCDDGHAITTGRELTSRVPAEEAVLTA